jgi:hypothetical protein
MKAVLDDILSAEEQQEFSDLATLEIADRRRAVAAKFFEHVGRLDIRELWSRGDTSYFRVNWWKLQPVGEHRICESAFVEVRRTKHGFVVQNRTLERTGRAA